MVNGTILTTHPPTEPHESFAPRTVSMRKPTEIRYPLPLQLLIIYPKTNNTHQNLFFFIH